MNWLERITYHLKLEWVIQSMQIIITERREKRIEAGEPETILLDDPREDELYGESIKRINILREFQANYLHTINALEFLGKREAAATAKTVHLEDENKRLRQELETLKQNIEF